jgi:aspartate-semialdehyde dehydrogenase
MSGYIVAVVGATGAVGTKMKEMLESSTLPIKGIKFLASKRSAGKEITFKEEMYIIEELTSEAFLGTDIALFSAGGSISQEFVPEAAKRGCVVIDNTSAFRMDEGVPLVVPEVNPHHLNDHKGIIANPNCSTIQMMVALEPLRQAYGLNRIIVSTYQAVSGAGVSAINELTQQATDMLAGKEEIEANILPCSGDKKHYPLAFNALPQIDVFGEDGYTQEEWKMINETKKIMSDESKSVSATCVRVPVMSGHSESIYIELEKEDVKVSDIQEILKTSPGIVLEDNPKEQLYPQPLTAVGKKEVFVGRIRRDLDVSTGFHMWVVSDNLLKGAAWNSVQIAEKLHEMNLVKVSR